MSSGEPEIFLSLQGEGATMGVPSVFLRLALCNLRCAWCDTKYTWDWSAYDFEREVASLPPEEVQRRILSFGCLHLIVTGGEPLLQQKQLAPLMQTLKALPQPFFVEVETNGTIVPSDGMARAVDQWNVSPKTSNSGNTPEAREVPEALHFFARTPSAYFKFVVEAPEDLAEVRQLASRYGIPRERIILMPQATDEPTLLERGTWLAGVCTSEGFRFSTRLHILLWGDKRGR